jgi:hypothetical protein
VQGCRGFRLIDDSIPMRCYSCGLDLLFSPTKFKIVKSLKLVPFFSFVPSRTATLKASMLTR